MQEDSNGKAPVEILDQHSVKGAERLRADEVVQLHPMESLREDPEATMPATTVINLLLQLEWPRYDDNFLEKRIGQLYDDLRRADFQGDKEAVVKYRTQALRLEGAVR
eukprot:Skav209239  [mRNA]  locus=scaffold293:469802:477770:- [translate_table: standard]